MRSGQLDTIHYIGSFFSLLHNARADFATKLLATKIAIFEAKTSQQLVEITKCMKNTIIHCSCNGHEKGHMAIAAPKQQQTKHMHIHERVMETPADRCMTCWALQLDHHPMAVTQP